jgi:hypothetical protein
MPEPTITWNGKAFEVNCALNDEWSTVGCIVKRGSDRDIQFVPPGGKWEKLILAPFVSDGMSIVTIYGTKDSKPFQWQGKCDLTMPRTKT